MSLKHLYRTYNLSSPKFISQSPTPCSQAYQPSSLSGTTLFISSPWRMFAIPSNTDSCLTLASKTLALLVKQGQKLFIPICCLVCSVGVRFFYPRGVDQLNHFLLSPIPKRHHPHFPCSIKPHRFKTPS